VSNSIHEKSVLPNARRHFRWSGFRVSKEIRLAARPISPLGGRVSKPQRHKPAKATRQSTSPPTKPSPFLRFINQRQQFSAVYRGVGIDEFMAQELADKDCGMGYLWFAAKHFLLESIRVARRFLESVAVLQFSDTPVMAGSVSRFSN
jgi:hypothetical protein